MGNGNQQNIVQRHLDQQSRFVCGQEETMFETPPTNWTGAEKTFCQGC